MRVPYLILAKDKNNLLYGAIRKVDLYQVDSTRVGRVQIGDEVLIVEGVYGNNGQPLSYENDLTDKARNKFTQLIEEWSPNLSYDDLFREVLNET